MRKIFVFTNISLDGYFEAPGHDISGFTNDNEAFSDNQGETVDTLLFGHTTYDMMKFWGTPQAQEQMPEIAAFMTDNPKFVASHKLFDPGWKNVTVLSQDVVGQVRQLKEQPGQTIAMFGSNNLCVSLMQAGLIDEFRIVVNPVAFGDGTPLFKGLPGKAALTLTDTQRYKSGTVLLSYVPAAKA